MKSFTFAEINLAKKCFRVARIIAADEASAKYMIPGGCWGWALLGEQQSRSKKSSVRTRLIYSKRVWSDLVSMFGLTTESAEERIRIAQAVGPEGPWWSGEDCTKPGCCA